MLDVFVPVFRQLEETVDAVRIAIELAGPNRLGWRPSPDTPTFAEIVEHIANGNLAYATVIGPANVRRKWEYEPSPAKEWLLARLDESLTASRVAIEGVTADNIHDSRADDWNPNCEEQTIEGPLDALWFAMQMARHTAYHLGQLNFCLRLMGDKA